MKLSEITRLLRLTKAKADAEKARFTAITASQDALIAAANQHAQEGSQPYESNDETITGGDLSAYGRYLRRLCQAEKECRRAAEALENEKQARKSALSRSLGEEAAWTKLRGDALAARRKKSEDAEEASRGEFVSGAAAAARRGLADS